MTAPTEADNVVQCVCTLGIFELADRNEMMNIWFVADLFGRNPTVLTAMVITSKRLASDFAPPSVIDVLGRPPSLRKREGVTVLATKPDRIAVGSRLEDSDDSSTELTNPLCPFDIVNFVRWSTEKVSTLVDTRRTVLPVLVRRIVFELIATPFTGRRLRRIAPVAVVFAGVRITVVAELPSGLRIVELEATPTTGSIRQWLAVDFRVVLVHATLRRERLPARRTVHDVVGLVIPYKFEDGHSSDSRR